MDSQRQLFTGIDYLKFLCALMVVAIHIGMPYYLEIPLRIAVPFFFISSSFLFWHKKKSLGEFIKRMAILYFAWFVLELPFVFTRFSTTNIWGIIKSFFFSNTFYASWYLTASIEGMALCVLLSKWLSNKWLLFVGGVLYCLAVFGGGYFGIVPNYIQSLLLSLDNIIPLTNSFIPAFISVCSAKSFLIMPLSCRPKMIVTIWP